MHLFPSGIASGDSFYNRSNERKELKRAIEHNQHTTIIAPRRFGKTSLIRKVLDENKHHYVWIDLMAFTGRDEVTAQIIKHVGDLVIKLGKTEEKIKRLVTKFLGFLKPELSLEVASKLTFKLKFSAQEAKSAATVTEILMTLDEIAKHAKTRIVFVFDEFQEIVHLEETTNAYQGAIRHAVERSQHVTYLFSGSKHASLRTLFTGKKNPLYELCNLLPISLVSESYYRKYLKKESEKHWGKPMSDDIIDRIIAYTNCYPKYVNALCLLLWTTHKKLTIALVDVLWETFMFSRKSTIREELSSLKMSDRKLLKSLCFEKTKEPTSFEYARISLVPGSTAGRSIKELMRKDFIYIDDEGYYQPIDPTYQSYFKLFG